MLVEKLTVSVWVMLFVIAGSGVDYIRIRRVDKQVLCYFAVTGLITGGIFQYAGNRWGAGRGLLTALLTAVIITVLSRKFIWEHIINVDRETETERTEKWKREFEALKKETEQRK